MKTKNRLLRVVAAVAVATGVVTFWSGSADAKPVSPSSACGDQGGIWYSDVVHDYGYTCHRLSQKLFFLDNGSNVADSTTFTSTTSGTVTSSVAASISSHESIEIVSMEEQLNISVEISSTWSHSTSTTLYADPHMTLYAEYAEKQRKATMSAYELNANCDEINYSSGLVYFNHSTGWHTWEEAYNG